MEGNGKRVRRILRLVLIANAAVSAVKLAVGASCGSMSVLADGFHSVSDSASNIVGLIGVRLASKPIDTKHPYGHGKFEIMSALFIGIMLMMIAAKLVFGAAEGFFKPRAVMFEGLDMILMAATLLINIFVSAAEFRAGKRLSSAVLVADSIHTRGDCMISGAVLVGMALIRAGLPACLDAVISLAVAAAVMLSALRIIKECTDVLVDSAAVSSDEVRELLMKSPEVRDVHKIRSRGMSGSVFIDLHAVVDPNENVCDMHTLSHRLEEMLKEHFGLETQVCIHIEPDDGMHGGGEEEL